MTAMHMVRRYVGRHRARLAPRTRLRRAWAAFWWTPAAQPRHALRVSPTAILGHVGATERWTRELHALNEEPTQVLPAVTASGFYGVLAAHAQRLAEIEAAGRLMGAVDLPVLAGSLYDHNPGA